MWNLRDAVTWVSQLRDRIEKHEDGCPQFRLGLWRQLYDTPSFKQFFTAAEENSWDYNIPGTVDIVVDRALSKSYTVVLPDAEKKSITEDIKGYLQNDKGKVWIDESQGLFEYPYKTLVVTATKK